MKRFTALAAAVVLAATGCSVDSAGKDDNVVNVVVGYQSKTINTVTAGTLLRAKGFLENRLADITKRTNTKYNVTWPDYDTGAPITAQMVAEKIDIGCVHEVQRIGITHCHGENSGVREYDVESAEFCNSGAERVAELTAFAHIGLRRHDASVESLDETFGLV